MHINRRALNKSPIPFLGILPRGISKESRTERLAHLHRVPATAHHSVIIPAHNRLQLLPDILGTLHTPCLDEVVKTPRVGEAGDFPAVVDVEEGEMVAVGVVELRLLLVGLLLLFLGAVEDGLHREHGDDRKDLVGAAHVDRGYQDFGE